MNLDLTLFGENLKRYREALGKSQEKSGEENGIGKAGISNYENGVSFPKQAFLMRLVLVYKADINKMLTLKGYGDPAIEAIAERANANVDMFELNQKLEKMQDEIDSLKSNSQAAS